MRIFGNDYQSNFTNQRKASQGGTLSFSLLLSDFLTKSGHTWIGLSVKSCKEFGPAKLIHKSKKKIFWQMCISTKKINKIFSSRDKINFAVSFREEISAIKNLLENAKPDVVMINGCYFKLWLILVAASELKIPIVMQHAGIPTRELEMFAQDYSKNILKAYFEAEKDFSKLSSFEIFLNDWTRKIYDKEIFKTNPNKRVIIPLPIPENAKTAKRKMSSGKELKIGIVARWDPIKNHKAVLSLAKEAKKQGLPWKFYAVFAMPKKARKNDFRQEYKKMVTVLDPIKKSALARFYKKMDLTILPSHFDASPHVVPESILNGTPALISPNTGWTDYFEKSGANNWVIDFDDTDKVVERIKDIKGKEMPKKLINMIKSKNNSQKCLNQYLTLFKKVCKNRNK